VIAAPSVICAVVLGVSAVTCSGAKVGVGLGGGVVVPPPPPAADELTN